jgi:hypothetical protein
MSSTPASRLFVALFVVQDLYFGLFDVLVRLLLLLLTTTRSGLSLGCACCITSPIFCMWVFSSLSRRLHARRCLCP